MTTEDIEEKFVSFAKYANIPITTRQTHRLEKFVRMAGNMKAYQAAANFVSPYRPHHFLTLVGERGRGKTHLALGIAWNLIETMQIRAKYFQVEELLDDLRSGFHATTQEDFHGFAHKMDAVKHVPLLILDDLGVEQSTEWARAKLDLIVDFRYLYNQLTVFTTNLAVDALEERIASRLEEGVIAIIKSLDYRKIKAQQRKKPHREGDST